GINNAAVWRPQRRRAQHHCYLQRGCKLQPQHLEHTGADGESGSDRNGAGFLAESLDLWAISHVYGNTDRKCSWHAYRHSYVPRWSDNARYRYIERFRRCNIHHLDSYWRQSLNHGGLPHHWQFCWEHITCSSADG